MDKYNVSLTSRALRDMDGIYDYTAQTLMVPETALGLADKIEKEILSLENMPYRFPERKAGPPASGFLLKQKKKSIEKSSVFNAFQRPRDDLNVRPHA